MKFAVFGSCVSRDVFNFLDNQSYTVTLTTGGIPLTSMYDGNRLEIDHEDIVISSNYVNRMIEQILHKTGREILFASDAEYLFFDLAAERLPLQTWILREEQSMIPVTWNTHRLGKKLQQNEKYQDLQIEGWHLSDDEKEVWVTAIHRFCEDIKKKWGGKIIYLQTRQEDYFLDHSRSRVGSLTIDRNDIDVGIDTRELRERQNKIIEEAEKILFEILPDLYVIPRPANTLVSANHHFGIHPLHFDYSYYEYAAGAVRLIVDHPCGADSRRSINQNISFLRRSCEDHLLSMRSLCNGIVDRMPVFYWGGGATYLVFAQMQDIRISGKVIGKSVCDVFARNANLAIKSDVFAGIEQEECRQFMRDVNRNAVEMLRYADAALLVIDLMAETHDYICFGGNDDISMDAYSEGLYQNLKNVYGNVRRNHYTDNNYENVEAGLLKLCQMINQRHIRVILNEMYKKEFWFDGKRMRKFDGVAVKNAYLEKCYAVLKQNIEQVQCITMPAYSFSYSDKHADSLSGEEYLYYQRVFRCLLDGGETEPILREQLIRNQMFMKEYGTVFGGAARKRKRINFGEMGRKKHDR